MSDRRAEAHAVIVQHLKSWEATETEDCIADGILDDLDLEGQHAEELADRRTEVALADARARIEALYKTAKWRRWPQYREAVRECLALLDPPEAT